MKTSEQINYHNKGKGFLRFIYDIQHLLRLN